jgi:hypothetical protein
MRPLNGMKPLRRAGESPVFSTLPVQADISLTYEAEHLSKPKL